jgi:hypothetical protein
MWYIWGEKYAYSILVGKAKLILLNNLGTDDKPILKCGRL